MFTLLGSDSKSSPFFADSSSVHYIYPSSDGITSSGLDQGASFIASSIDYE